MNFEKMTQNTKIDQSLLRYDLTTPSSDPVRACLDAPQIKSREERLILMILRVKPDCEGSILSKKRMLFVRLMQAFEPIMMVL